MIEEGGAEKLTDARAVGGTEEEIEEEGELELKPRERPSNINGIAIDPTGVAGVENEE